MTDPQKERFVRWQGRTIEQMGYSINTLLIITSATIGFTVSYLLKCNIQHIKYILYTGTVLLIICIASLLIVTINRLHDFRATARNIKEEDKIVDTDFIGKVTWWLFYLSIILFIIGQSFIMYGFKVAIYK